MSTHSYPPKMYLHTHTHAQNIPPLTPTHIKNVHLPPPTQNIPPPTPTHHYPPIKNSNHLHPPNIYLHTPPHSQNIPPLTLHTLIKGVQPPPSTQNILPHIPTYPKYTSTHPHPPIKNVHPTRLAQNIPSSNSSLPWKVPMQRHSSKRYHFNKCMKMS